MSPLPTPVYERPTHCMHCRTVPTPSEHFAEVLPCYTHRTFGLKRPRCWHCWKRWHCPRCWILLQKYF